ncbi:hypothetical protein I5509_11675 [Acinetobacter baumannii]|uniref:hypothetical protein n=1 Tax=Acinetobacter baumannii TaxID=470 RepID=UPI0002D0EC42|nr:hypothetical protein [Acinetobacter baumannii]ENV26674.1 hypothetical protein F962_01180 [Acinetobacter baumannii NIPH 190]MBJ9700997.1 hypothetical protein [Acinetobacter baumannii]
MKATKLIRDKGLKYAKEIVDSAPDNATEWNEGYEFQCGQSVEISKADREKYFVDLVELKRLVESVDLIEKLGGYGKCKFYMTGMKLNKCDSVKCPKTGLIVSRAALEIAINDYRESIYGGGDE